MSHATAHAAWKRFFCLPRRDLLFLPMVSVVTLLALLGAAEIGCRLLWQGYGEGACLIPDERLGSRWTPECTAHVKNLETVAAVYRFNECGFRSSQSCAAKPPGELRLVAIGSSGVFGYWLDAQDTFPMRLARRLSGDCHERADVQNLGLPGASPQIMAKRLDEAIALQADVVIVGMSAGDIFNEAQVQWQASRIGALARLWASAKNWSRESRLVAVARHYLYENRARYIQAQLLREAPTLHGPLPPGLESTMQGAEQAIGQMAARLRAARIPLVVVYLPDRLRAILSKGHEDFPGLDPYLIRDRLRAAAQRYGAIFADPSPEFASASDPGSLFYPADGHMRMQGQILVADAAFRSLAASGHPGAPGICGNPRGQLAVAWAGP